MRVGHDLTKGKKKKDICIEVGRGSNSDFWKYDMMSVLQRQEEK